MEEIAPISLSKLSALLSINAILVVIPVKTMQLIVLVVIPMDSPISTIIPVYHHVPIYIIPTIPQKYANNATHHVSPASGQLVSNALPAQSTPTALKCFWMPFLEFAARPAPIATSIVQQLLPNTNAISVMLLASIVL